jgi:hypothetical protein
MRYLVVIASVAGVMALAPGGAQAQSQSGSAGGTIGKQGRSASGSGSPDGVESKQEQPRKDAGPGSSGPLTAASLRGRWTGSLNCPDGQWALSFDIRENSATSFGGDYGGEGGKIVSGQFSGGRITFVTQAFISRTWTGSVSRSGSTLRMQGTHKADWGTSSPGAGNCRFSATKS